MTEAPDVETVLDALDDAAAREILEALSEPMTAGEVAGECDLPRSSVYRKLNRLSTASLLETETKLRPDGHHTTLYRVDFDSVVVGFADHRSITVDVVRPAAPGARLESMWAEVRREA
jgi:predicted transcriptional regulator